MISLQEYIQNPCRASSIPFWKTKQIMLPKYMKIIHDDCFDAAILSEYDDEPYFRLRHLLIEVCDPMLPSDFHFSTAEISEFAEHINCCYSAGSITAEELEAYQTHPVYASELWITIRDHRTGQIVASGIGELDQETGEGILEWIQVSEPYRGMGLGTCIVRELLRRMQGKAKFATVSGQCQNPTNPERLYRSCGFEGDDIWHVLVKRNNLT